MTRTPWPVAVIGAGCASPTGFGWRGLAASLESRWFARSQQLAATHADVIGAEVPAIPAAHDVGDRKVHRLMARGARLGAIAAHAALVEAGLGEHHETAGWFYGVGASGSAPDEINAVLRASVDEDHVWSERRMGERGLKVFHPLRTFALMPNFTLCHAAILEGVRGPSAAMFSRGAGTVTGLVEAAWAITDGDCTAAIAGGADTALDCLTWSELVRDGHPRAGLVPGEGGGAIVLAARSERPLAWITGASVHAIGTAAGASELAGSLRAALDEVGAADVYVLAAWGAVADAARTIVDGPIVDLHASIGDALAGAPALAWCAALDLIAEGRDSVVAISAGPDGHVAAVRFASARTAPSRAPAVIVPKRRAVITGVGAVSALGIGFGSLLDGLAAGARGIRPISCFDASPLASRIGGQVALDRLDASWLAAHLPHELLPIGMKWLELGALRDRKVGWALVAAAEAWRHAGLTDQRDVPLALACGLERGLVEDLAPVLGTNGVDWAAEARRMSPTVRNRAPVDLAARAVADLLGLGTVTVHASACAAGAIAIAHGAALVERGNDLVVCGAADAMLDPISVGAMITLGTTSSKNDLDACKPFDRRRDGLVLGEGAAVFVIEDEAHAERRGARPLARMLGWGASQDAYRPSAPNPEGTVSALAMSRALERAGVSPTQVGYINAHGTGTPLNDVAEVRALRRALGSHADGIPVSSLKGALGHLMTAAGAIEIAGSLLAFERDLLPGTASHRERDPDCNLDIIGEQPRSARVDTVMANSFGFGGQNSVVVIGRPS